ncbi:MAG: hydrogenase maturation protease [Candidatus Brocadiaceae bacterium]|nr:hydrogenase maturation protease [Candidatus Brocadiaceae bacterium]
MPTLRYLFTLPTCSGYEMSTNQLAQKPPPILVIGVGNLYRGDDAVGRIVAQGLKREATDRVNIIEKDCDGAALMECWESADAVILIDAVHSGALPGTILRFDAQVQPIPATYFHYSSHAFGVAEAVELSRTLNQLPPRFIVYGIEGKCFEPGSGITGAVAEAAQDVLEQIQKDVALFVAQGFRLDGF